MLFCSVACPVGQAFYSAGNPKDFPIEKSHRQFAANGSGKILFII